MNIKEKHQSRKRKYFSWRFVVTALLVILQVLISAVFMRILGTFYLWVQLLFDIVAFISLIIIINKDDPAEHKLPWAVIILALPVAGIIIYIIFGSPKQSPKVKRRFNEVNKRASEILGKDESTQALLKQKNPDGYILSNYLHGVSHLPVYANTTTQFFTSGEQFFERLKRRLNEAKSYIFLEFFIISEGYMWNEIHDILLQKVQEGVEVFVLYDDIGSMKKLPYNFDSKLRHEGINCFKFSPFYPVVSVVHNNRDHRKVVVIDGEVAFTGGINLADEYINKESPFGHWKDCAIEISGEGVDNFVLTFVQLYNLYCHKPLDVNGYIKDGGNNYREPDADIGFVHPFVDGPRPLYESNIGQTLFKNIISSAKSNLYITTPYLIVNNSILEALCMRAQSGVDVRIITPHIPDKKPVFIMTRSNYARLIAAGVKIYEYGPGFIHSKSIVCDDRIAFVGTINFDYRSFVHHYECGVLLIDTPSIGQIKKDFLSTIEADGIEQTLESSKLTLVQKLVKIAISLFAPLL